MRCSETRRSMQASRTSFEHLAKYRRDARTLLRRCITLQLLGRPAPDRRFGRWIICMPRHHMPVHMLHDVAQTLIIDPRGLDVVAPSVSQTRRPHNAGNTRDLRKDALLPSNRKIIHMHHMLIEHAHAPTLATLVFTKKRSAFCKRGDMERIGRRLRNCGAERASVHDSFVSKASVRRASTVTDAFAKTQNGRLVGFTTMLSRPKISKSAISRASSKLALAACKSGTGLGDLPCSICSTVGIASPHTSTVCRA